MLYTLHSIMPQKSESPVTSRSIASLDLVLTLILYRIKLNLLICIPIMLKIMLAYVCIYVQSTQAYTLVWLYPCRYIRIIIHNILNKSIIGKLHNYVCEEQVDNM